MPVHQRRCESAERDGRAEPEAERQMWNDDRVCERKQHEIAAHAAVIRKAHGQAWPFRPMAFEPRDRSGNDDREDAHDPGGPTPFHGASYGTTDGQEKRQPHFAIEMAKWQMATWHTRRSRRPVRGIVHSLRSATAGSTREARKAGARYPSVAAAATAAAVSVKTIGSVGLT